VHIQIPSTFFNTGSVFILLTGCHSNVFPGQEAFLLRRKSTDEVIERRTVDQLT
jgi:hypothetical protein